MKMGGRPGIPEEPRKLLKTQVGQEWGWLFSEEHKRRLLESVSFIADSGHL
jgi:hypothetical protein